MTEIEMAEIAKSHWRQYLPNRYRQLLARDELDEEALAVAKWTHRS